jgi:large conductance mechanosensitive channel
MFKEFKEFALKGNLIDTAIAFVMGAAFVKLSTAFIEDLIMPWVGKIAGGMDFSNMFIPLFSKAVKTTTVDGKELISEVPISSLKTLAQAKEYGSVLAYGDFVTVAINFFILAFVMFMIVKAINRAKALAAKAEAAAPAPGPTTEEKLLGEIRDLLKAGR